MFVQDVRDRGLSVTADTSVLEPIGEVTDERQERSRGVEWDSATSACASLAVRRALTGAGREFWRDPGYRDSQPPVPGAYERHDRGAGRHPLR